MVNIAKANFVESFNLELDRQTLDGSQRQHFKSIALMYAAELMMYWYLGAKRPLVVYIFPDDDCPKVGVDSTCYGYLKHRAASLPVNQWLLLHLGGYAAGSSENEDDIEFDFFANRFWTTVPADWQNSFPDIWWYAVKQSREGEKAVKSRILRAFWAAHYIINRLPSQLHEAGLLLLQKGTINRQGIDRLFDSWGNPENCDVYLTDAYQYADEKLPFGAYTFEEQFVAELMS